MKLSDLLFKFSNNSNMSFYINNAKNKPMAYIKYEKTDSGYKLEPTNLFNDVLHATKTSMFIDDKMQIKEASCGCLNFFKTKECVHICAMYYSALEELNHNMFEYECDSYLRLQQMNTHKDILKKLAGEIQTTNPYFGKIHLIPVIEENDKLYSLSLKIGFDKDYVIKSISEFINMTENNIFYSYGQKLEFVHSYECLDAISKVLYTFLANISSPDTEKSLIIRKSQLLRIFEIYKDNIIFYKKNNEEKAVSRLIQENNNFDICLNSNYLYVNSSDSELLVSGVNYAYFINDTMIYAYPYKSRTEGKIFGHLFKLQGKLMIDAASDEFISEILPVIKKDINIENDFFEKYPIPDIKINSYFSYVNSEIVLTPKISCKEIDRRSPYLRQLLDGYFKNVESHSFIRNQEKKYYLPEIENQYKFLTGDLSNIKSFGDIFFDENMKNLKAKKASKTRVNISYNVGLLDFKFENQDLTLEDIQAMLQAYHEKKRFIKLKDNTILEIDEQSAKEITDFLEDFNISIKEINKPVKKSLNYLLKLVSGVDNNLKMDDEVVRIIKTIQNYKNSDYLPTANLKDSLREYQIDGFKWLKTLSQFGFGGILADDMGLGKTLEMISFLISDEKEMPSLIVCPMSLVYNWQIECEKWGYNNNVTLILGSSEDRENIIKNIVPNKKLLYVTSYDSLRRDSQFYSNIKFRYIIADEAQFIKNQFAQKSEAIKSLNSEINYALTGTPIENGLADLWSIFDFLMPGYLSNYNHFKNRYESLIVHDDTEALNNLKKRVAPFILRRTKKDVLKDLPDKIEDYYYCKMEAKQREVYDSFVLKLKDDLNNGASNVLALLTRLRQVCITPELIYQEPFVNTKIDMALDIIKSSIEAGHRILLFSQFAQSFPIISRELDNMGIKHFILDGQTKAKVRMDMVEEFNNNEDYKIFIISLKAGGTGLNLTGADMVIHLDPWWNSSAESQATDRTYRIGQTKNVTVIKLICKDTIEEKVIHLQKLKKELAESIVIDDEKKPVKLTKKDILELLD